MERVFIFLLSSLLVGLVSLYFYWAYCQSDYYKRSSSEGSGGVVMVDKYFHIYCEYKNDN